MVTHAKQPPDPPPCGYLLQYADAVALQQGISDLRAQGYRRIEAFTPFPVHGLDRQLEIAPTRLGWMVLIAGVLGGMGAWALQWWTNAVDYPFLISGKPRFSLPANIPVTFEVIILSAAFAAFIGMLALNGLPRLAHPLLRSERFLAATTDGFFLLVEATDPQFRLAETAAAGKASGAVHVELLSADGSESSGRFPRPLVLAACAVSSFLLVPPLWVMASSKTLSDKPRIHNFFDMDFQPKYKPQTKTALFADQRSMRPRVEGTLPRGRIVDNPALLHGRQPQPSGDAASRTLQETPEPLADAARNAAPAAEPLAATPEAQGDGSGDPDWVTEFPLPVTERLMLKGQQQFNIFCATCHGKAGEGNGLVSQRALDLEQGTWVPPTSIHAQYVRNQPVGQLYHTITHGVRKMPGYGHQITLEDRWAIALYVRALQRSQDATLADVPEELRVSLRERN